MSIMIKTRQAYSEIDEFLGLLSEEQRNEIPKKLRDFFKEEKDQEYFKNIDKDISIKDQNDSESSHNPKVVSSSFTPATKFIKKIAFLDFKNFWENGGYFGNSLFLKGKMV